MGYSYEEAQTSCRILCNYCNPSKNHKLTNGGGIIYLVKLIIGALFVYVILNPIIKIDKNRLLAVMLCLLVSVLLNLPV